MTHAHTRLISPAFLSNTMKMEPIWIWTGEIWRLETSTNLCLLLDLVLTSVELIDEEGEAFYGHPESHVSTDFQLRTLDTHVVLFFSGKSLHVNHFFVSLYYFTCR